MKKAVTTVAVIVALQALLLAGYLLRQDRPAPIRVEHEDRPAPELVFLRRDGSEGRMSGLRGKPVLVHFWATWCPPCREELPGLLEFSTDPRVELLAVSLDRSWSDVDAFAQLASDAPVVLAKTSTISDAFRVPRLPETLLVDRDGRIRLRFAGARDWTSDEMKRLIADSASRTTQSNLHGRRESR